jgi:hypothetical protein
MPAPDIIPNFPPTFETHTHGHASEFFGIAVLRSNLDDGFGSVILTDQHYGMTVYYGPKNPSPPSIKTKIKIAGKPKRVSRKVGGNPRVRKPRKG